MLLSLGGNLETAFALPAVYSNQYPPPSDSEDGSVTEYDDGVWFEYEPDTVRWHFRGIKSMVVEAADNVTFKTSEFVVEADNTRINSDVVIYDCVTRSSFQVSNETKERYNQCTNIECGHTFVTHETFVRSVCRPQKISEAPPHPKGMQEQFAY